MAQKIVTKEYLVRDIFQDWYRIPEYQRPYVWGTEQVTELLDDIYQAQDKDANRESQYFLGSMVLKKNERTYNGSRYTEFDVLDGQQRLITLFFITAIVRDLTIKNDPNNSRLGGCKTIIYQKAAPDFGTPERLRIVFDIRDKVKNFIGIYIKEDGGTEKCDSVTIEDIIKSYNKDISIKNMANAILTIRNYFNNGKSIDKFFPYLMSNVLMISVSAEELEDAFHLFTVMNNRGLKLRNSDIIKAENLAKIQVDDERAKWATKWENIEEFFGEDFDNFLSHLRTILVKQKAEYNLLKEYEVNIYEPKEYDKKEKIYIAKEPLLTKGKDTFEFIEKYYNHYLRLFDDEDFLPNKSFEFHNYLTLMEKGFEADYWKSALLLYYNKFNVIKLIEFIKSLDSKFSADWIMGLSPTLRIENINLLLKKIEDVQNPDDVLSFGLLKINNIELKKILNENDVYGRRYARYLLLKIDLLYHGHTSPFSPPSTISIEHILPQNPSEGSKWEADFNEDDRKEWTDKLGNLVLISRRKNTSQSNLDFAQKKEKYFKKNVELFSNSIRVVTQFDTWTLDDLKKNHADVLNKLLP